MDIPPLVPPLLEKHCGGPTRQCMVGDSACRADAEHAGLVVIARHGVELTLCEARGVSHWPTPFAGVVGVVLSLAVAGYVYARRRRKAR